MVELSNEVIEGRRCELIDYTGKVVISRAEEEKRFRDEIRRDKALTGNRAPWVVTSEPPGYDLKYVWNNDPTNRMKQIYNKVAEKLKEEKGLVQ